MCVGLRRFEGLKESPYHQNLPHTYILLCSILLLDEIISLVGKIYIFVCHQNPHFSSFFQLKPSSQVVILQASAPSAPHPRATRGAATPAPSPPRTAPPWSPRRRSAAAARRGWRADEGRRWRPPSDPGALG